MLFRKRVCLVVTENWVKLKLFSTLTVKKGSRGVKAFPFLFDLQITSEKRERERERERTHRHSLREKEREKEGLTDTPQPQTQQRDRTVEFTSPI